MAKFEANSYAELVNKRAVPTQRFQTLTKLNPLGLGVLYNWNWQWSYSTNAYDTGLQRPSQANYGKGENAGKIKGEETTRYSGQFLYIGLSIQLPTMARIRDGHVKSINKEENRKLYRALGTAVYNEFSGFGENRNISNVLDIPQIFHICSLFDLSALEAYMIDKNKSYNGNTNYNSFKELVEENAKTASNGVVGVNSDPGGGGGPLFNSNRPIQEWVMAAYYYFKENNTDIKAARTSTRDGIPTSEITGKTLAEKIKSLFLVAHSRVGSKVTKKIIDDAGVKEGSPSLGIIPELLEAFGLKSITKEGIKLNDTQGIDEDDNFDLTTERGRKARDFTTALSIDTGIAQYKIFHSKSGFLSSARDKFIEEVLDINNLKNLKVIEANFDRAVATLTSQLRAARADAILYEAQLKNNAMKKALLNDGYKDLAEIVGYVQGQQELLKLMGDTKDIPEAFKKQLAPMIKKAKESLTKSFAALEVILQDALEKAQAKNKGMTKSKAIRSRGEYNKKP